MSGSPVYGEGAPVLLSLPRTIPITTSSMVGCSPPDSLVSASSFLLHHPEGGPASVADECVPCFESGLLFRLVTYLSVDYSSSASTLLPQSSSHHHPHPHHSHYSKQAARKLLKRRSSAAGGDGVHINNAEGGGRGIVTKERWAFYNDTTDTMMRVVGFFSSDSELLPEPTVEWEALPRGSSSSGIGNTEKDGYQASGRSGSGGGDGSGRGSATGSGTASPTASAAGYRGAVMVPPGATVPFVEGQIFGFRLEFHLEPLPALDVQFIHGAPSVFYSSLYRCFKNVGNGLLFRLVQHSGSSAAAATTDPSRDPDAPPHRWFFYNDTLQYRMKVTVDFAEPSEVKPLHIAIPQDSNGGQGANSVPGTPGGLTHPQILIGGTPSAYPHGVCYETVVTPQSTQPFIEGTPVEYRLDVIAEVIDTPLPGTASSTNHHHHGGRSSRSSSGRGSRDCDVTDGAGSSASAAGDANHHHHQHHTHLLQSDDPPSPSDATPLSSPIPASSSSPAPSSSSPLAAVPSPLITMPLPSRMFENGHPDPAIIPHLSQVVPCFKENGNGLLFRLVDEVHDIWAFYNDTRDYRMQAMLRISDDDAATRIKFAPGVTVDSVCVVKESGESVRELHITVAIGPLETVPFLVYAPHVFDVVFNATPIERERLRDGSV